MKKIEGMRPRTWARGAGSALLGLLLMLPGSPLTGMPELNPGPGDGTVGDPPIAEVTRRNVLFLIMDDVGVDQIARYVNHYNGNSSSADDMDVTPPSTPTITDLAEAGVTFLNGWSNPTCSPTRAGAYTGTFGFRNGVIQGGELDPGTTTTIAEILSGAGYRSGLFGKWHLGGEEGPDGSLVGLSPMGHGWNRFFGFLGALSGDYWHWEKVESFSVDTGLGPLIVSMEVPSTTYITLENANDAAEWIAMQSGPWMATVAFHAAHMVDDGSGNATLQGQDPPRECVTGDYSGGSDKDILHATIECMDYHIAELLNSIDDSQLVNTTIILIGDNGTTEELTDFAPFLSGSDRPSHAKGSVYEGGINVPFIIADGSYLGDYLEDDDLVVGMMPGRVMEPGRVETALVQTLDIFATVAEIAGTGGSSGVDSVSLIPLLRGTATSVRNALFMQTETHQTVRGNYFKLVVDGNGNKELYFLVADRWEENDLLADGPGSFEETMVTLLCTKMSNLTSGLCTCSSLCS